MGSHITLAHLLRWDWHSAPGLRVHLWVELGPVATIPSDSAVKQNFHTFGSCHSKWWVFVRLRTNQCDFTDSTPTQQKNSLKFHSHIQPAAGTYPWLAQFHRDFLLPHCGSGTGFCQLQVLGMEWALAGPWTKRQSGWRAWRGSWEAAVKSICITG